MSDFSNRIWEVGASFARRYVGRTSAYLIAILALLIPELCFAKPIRLRNRTFEPDAVSSSKAAATHAARPARHGPDLFIVQFDGPVTTAWREQVRALNVALLKAVPEDAFVVEVDSTKLGDLRKLPFVRSVTHYSADLKVHSAIRSRGYGVASAQGKRVRILMSPASSESAKLRQALKKISRESHSRFGTILDTELTSGEIEAIAASPAVLWIEAAPDFELVDEVAAKIVAGGVVDGIDHSTFTQELGYDGTGVTVAVADSGLNFGTAVNMHPDLANRANAFFFYGTLEDASDEHGHGTHVSGIIAGDGALGEADEAGALYGLGIAPGAHLVAQRIFDGVGNYEAPPSFERLTRDAVRSGASIGSNSWGDDTQGRYDLSAAEFDGLVRDADALTPGDQQYILEFSAGNAGAGSQTIGSPAVAKNVIATGASQNNRFDFFLYADGQETMADFSSRGPCEDGRIKPDLVAPGTWIASLQSGAASDQNAWLPISPNYQYQGGTSQAGPQVSGAAAVFVQFYRETQGLGTPSPAMVKAALINSAVDMDNTVETLPVPNHDEGWGRVDLTEIVGEERDYHYVDQTVLLATGQVYEHRILVGSSSEPLKITLTYTDVPGFPAAIPALVNNLDLEVVGPNGTLYRGNQFHNGESIPDPAEADGVNNVEAVHLAAPRPGEYLVRIRAINVAEDARLGTAMIDQDFALVISGILPPTGTGILAFDRDAYTAPATIQLKLLDSDLNGQPAVETRIRSTTEANGEPVSLKASGAGVFTNAVLTATGTAAADGRLQVSHGDLIEVIYEDASPAGTRIATARADLRPPIITTVESTNRFGQAIITWQTDEPSTSTVQYGLDRSLTVTVNDRFPTTDHRVAIQETRTGVEFLFRVISTDEAGNSSTNDNSGAFYKFMVLPAPTVLLVDAFVDPVWDIPVETYTGPLDEIGVSYEVWDVLEQGSPTAANLKPFRVVIWRVPEANDTPLSGEDQNTIKTYLQAGGALLMASMELLTRLDSGGFGSFRTNVLHVESFQTDAQVPIARGADNDPITSEMELVLDYTAYDVFGGFIDPDFSDTFTPTGDAVPILFESETGMAAGLRFPRTGLDSTGRVVFLSFPLDSVTETEEAPNNRRNLLMNILRFLAPGLNGLSSLTLDSPAYTIPSLVTVELADSDLIGRRELAVDVSSAPSDTSQRVRLGETAIPGLFRGTFALVLNTNQVVQPGQLATLPGETIHVAYLDDSSQSYVTTFATIDVTPASITGVAVENDYEEATVSWNTSEATDALVQFGESRLLGRTAYVAQHAVSHELTLLGLLPDRQYFFQVVSRDIAGNATVDDNGGRFYTFRTLKPFKAPWADNFENGEGDWTVFTGEFEDDDGGVGSGVTWELGAPQNELADEAVSPTHAWGTNLRGEGIDFATCDLISPAVELVGGNRAMLRFWHVYDFTERSELLDFEVGQIYVSTNNGRGWTILRQFEELSDGWEEEEIDLTPYIGRLVRLGWHYELLSFDTFPRPGWLLDDVSISITNILHGTISVTNNLSQAKFRITGPASIEGSGWTFSRTNAAPGEYNITWEPVLDYVTPEPQTNRLEALRRIAFTGTYTIEDANTNQISDAWEQRHFGVVAPDANATRDSDEDGASDFAEFIAGTNPTDLESKLRMGAFNFQANGTMRFEWDGVSGRAYRLAGTTDLMQWTPYSEWMRSEGAPMSYSLPQLTPGVNYFFRIEVQP